MKFKLCKKNEDKNEWFSHCQANNIPYILIQNITSQYADVHWDYITFDWPVEAMEKYFSNNENQIKIFATEIYEKYSNSKSELKLSGRGIDFYRLTLEDTNAAAEEIYDMIYGLIELISVDYLEKFKNDPNFFESSLKVKENQTVIIKL